jgi:hypothetical protein
MIADRVITGGTIVTPEGAQRAAVPEFTEPFELAAGVQLPLDTIDQIDATLTYA